MSNSLRNVFGDIADAIRDKGIEGTMKPIEMAEKIGEISTGEPIVEYKDVNFFRPDGKLLYSYTKEEVLADGWTMPAQPDWTIEWDVSSGQTSIEMNKDGWNWSLAKVLQCVNAQGVCNIAGDYTPTDGKTHILVDVTDTLRPDFSLYYKQSVARGVIVDWGDGTQTQDNSTAASQRNHTYAKGIYHLTVERVTGTVLFGSGSTSYNILGSFGANTRYKCTAVRYIVFGSNIQGSSYLLQYLSQLEHVVLSRTFTNYASCGYICQHCKNLSFISFPFQNQYQRFSGTCYYCQGLRTVVFAQDDINLGSSSFYYDTSLKNIVLPITTIFGSGDNFNNCNSITRLFFSDVATSTNFSSGSCQSCWNLREFIFANDIITIMSSNAFTNCFSLTKLAFPSNLATIQSQAFASCGGMALYDFRRATKVPSLSNVNAFSSMSSDCKIVVPDALYDTWIAATNWSSSTIVSHIVKASEYEDL